MAKPNLSNALQEATGNRPTAPTGPASRVGTVAVTFHLPRGVRDQLKILAAEQRTTMAALAGEGSSRTTAARRSPQPRHEEPRGSPESDIEDRGVMGKLARGLGVPAQRRCRGSMSTDEQQKRGGPGGRAKPRRD